MTVAPSSRRPEERAPAWCRARPTRTRRPESGSLVLDLGCTGIFRDEWTRVVQLRLLWDRQALPVDQFQDLFAAPVQQGFTNRFAEFDRIVPVTRFAKNFRPVRMG